MSSIGVDPNQVRNANNPYDFKGVEVIRYLLEF